MTEASPALRHWETDSVRLRPVWPAETRDRIVAAVFEDPHINTIQDIEWIALEFGMSGKDLRREFVEADFFFTVETHEGQPVYVICVTADGRAMTIMTSILKDHALGLTRLLKKLAKSPVAAAFKGAVTGCDKNDWRARWIKYLGYEPHDTYTDSFGVEMIVFRHPGAA